MRTAVGFDAGDELAAARDYDGTVTRADESAVKGEDNAFNAALLHRRH